MKLVNTEEMRKLDQQAMHQGGIPGLILMEHAGKAVADVAVEQVKGREYAKAVVLCGKGNNGGDGFVAARWLYNRGWQVRVLLAGVRPEELQGDAAAALAMLQQTGVDIYPVQSEDEINLAEIACVKADLLIDALLGTGFQGELQGIIKQLCQIMNASGKKIVAVDVPSGVNADTGAVDEAAVRAAATVTMVLAKTGFYLYPAEKHVGQLYVAV